MTEQGSPPTGKSPTYLLVSEKAGRDAIEFLREQREAGKSWRAVSLALLREYDVDVTEVTLRKWWADAHEGESAPAT